MSPGPVVTPIELSAGDLAEVRFTADGLVAVLPVDLDINDAMEDIIAALGGAERKLIGVVLNELTPPGSSQQRDKRYA